jgi:hypothetical protein
MIELFLSSDGKHTVHVRSESVEEMAKLAPEAKALYVQVLEEFGTDARAQAWTGNAVADKYLRVVKSADDETHAQEATAPQCPNHGVAMAFRRGRFGPFWSCPVKEPDGSWCPNTQEFSVSGNGHSMSA